MRRVVAALMLPVAVSMTGTIGAQERVTPQRQQALVRMVRQDCGACHGIRLNGGLGPALTPIALADKPLDAMVATIVHGRPGTPMPPWRAMLNETEARWIAEQLALGFPEEQRPTR